MLENPDADIRYRLPDLLAERSGGIIADDGYARAELWMSEGWATVQAECWRAPDYWIERDGEWWVFGLDGLRPVDPDATVMHVSWFEADAFAHWRGVRLPRRHIIEKHALNATNNAYKSSRRPVGIWF